MIGGLDVEENSKLTVSNYSSDITRKKCLRVSPSRLDIEVPMLRLKVS